MSKIRKNSSLNIAMLGHKVVPSRRGGIELVLTTLCPLIVKRGNIVTCFNRLGDQIENEYIGTVENGHYQGVKLKRVLTIHKKGLSAMTASITASFHAAFGKYDVVHYHAEGPCAMMWLPKLFGKTCIATVHGLDWQREKWKNGLASKYIKFGEKVLVKHADEIIVLSKGVQKYFEETYHRKTVLIPNGVIPPVIRDANEIITRFGLQKEQYFCTVARLTEEKGIHYLIEAYKKLKTDKKLVIVGDTSDTDDYVQKLKALAAGNPNIIFTGFASGELLDELYSNSYAFVIPSNLEGMPLTLLEAMSYGNAVIGSSIPEITDVVEDKAIIFEKGNVEDLSEKMQMLLDNPQKVVELEEQASGYICNKYNWDDIADKTVELYLKYSKRGESCNDKNIASSE